MLKFRRSDVEERKEVSFIKVIERRLEKKRTDRLEGASAHVADDGLSSSLGLIQKENRLSLRKGCRDGKKAHLESRSSRASVLLGVLLPSHSSLLSLLVQGQGKYEQVSNDKADQQSVFLFLL